MGAAVIIVSGLFGGSGTALASGPVIVTVMPDSVRRRGGTVTSSGLLHFVCAASQATRMPESRQNVPGAGEVIGYIERRPRATALKPE